MKKKISIIIPTQGEFYKLEKCLGSLAQQNFPQNEFEVLLCLNNFRKGLVAKNNQRVLTSSEGLNAARNMGIREAKGELIFFLDDDCELIGADFLSRVFFEFEQNKELQGCGGVYLSTEKANAFERVYNKNSRLWVESSLYENNKALFLLGGNFFVRKKLIRNCYFDEWMPWGGSELSFFIMAAQLGLVFEYRPSYSVQHNCRLGFVSILSKINKQRKGTQKYLQRGLLPRREIQVSLSCETMSERVVSKLIHFIFMPDKAAFIILSVFWPLRLLPRKSVNNLFSILFSRLTFLSEKYMQKK